MSGTDMTPDGKPTPVAGGRGWHLGHSPAQPEAGWKRAVKAAAPSLASAAFKGAADQRQAARRTVLAMAPEMRTESSLEMVDEVFVCSQAMARLTRNARLAAARRAVVLRLAPGELLCRAGQPQDRILVLISGQVEVREGSANGLTAPARHGHTTSQRPAVPHLGGSGGGAGSVLQRGDSVGALDLDWLARQPRHTLPVVSATTLGAGGLSGAGAAVQPDPLGLASPRLPSSMGPTMALVVGLGSAQGTAPGPGQANAHSSGDRTTDSGHSEPLTPPVQHPHGGSPLGHQDAHADELAATANAAHSPASLSPEPRSHSLVGDECGAGCVGRGARHASRPPLGLDWVVDMCREEAGQGRLGHDLDLGDGTAGRLCWPCTAVARSEVECASIGVQQLADVLSEEAWDLDRLVDTLEGLPVFAPLSSAELRQFARLLRLQVYPGGTVIYKQGSTGNDLFVIRTGYVRLLRQVTLDDTLRNRLNRMSVELATLRDRAAGAGGPGGGGSLTPRTGTPLATSRHGGGHLTARSSTGYSNELAGMQHRSGAHTHRDRAQPAFPPRPSTSQATARHRPLAQVPARVHPSRASLATPQQPCQLRQHGLAPTSQPNAHTGTRRSSITGPLAAWGASTGQAGGNTLGVGPMGSTRSSSTGGDLQGGPCRSAQRNRGRRRSSTACADELLAEFGVTPRPLRRDGGSSEEEELVMPAVVPDGGQDAHSASASPEVTCSGGVSLGPGVAPDLAGAGTGQLPPVGVPRLQLQRLAQQQREREREQQAQAAADAAAVPVWQPRAPRHMSPEQQVVFVELGTLGSGQCFGEVRGDGPAVRSSSAVCDTRTEVLVVSRAEVYHRLKTHVFDFLWGQVPSEGAPPEYDPELLAEAEARFPRPMMQQGHQPHVGGLVGSRAGREGPLKAGLAPTTDAAAALCAAQLERSMQWTLYKQKLVREVLAKKEERRRAAMTCR